MSAEAKYLDYTIEQGLNQPQSAKVDAVKKAVPPSTKTLIWAFLGFSGLLSMFYPQFFIHIQPIDTPHKEGAAKESPLDPSGRKGVPGVEAEFILLLNPPCP